MAKEKAARIEDTPEKERAYKMMQLHKCSAYSKNLEAICIFRWPSRKSRTTTDAYTSLRHR